MVDFTEDGEIVRKKCIPDGGCECVKITDQFFVLGRSAKSDKEVKRLKKIAETEASPAQFKKVFLCLLMISCVLTMNFLQPTDTYASPIGTTKCSPFYWMMMAGFVVICIVVTIVAIHISRNEQKLKIKYHVNYNDGDLVYQGKNLLQLILVGFLGGMIAGALGLGGGSIYNPAFLAMGVHPKSSGATGMFLVMISTINSVVINYVNGYLQIEYAVYISFFALLGSIVGMLATDKVVAKTGKPSILVWLLVFVFLISTISTPIFGYIQI